MYKFATHTWNPIKGVCHHGCKYCYMHPTWEKYRMGKPTLRQEEFTTNLNEGQRIFVGSSTDMFAENIKSDWMSECRIIAQLIMRTSHKASTLFISSNQRILNESCNSLITLFSNTQ